MTEDRPDGAPMPAESRGKAPGRGRLAGRHVLVVGAGQQTSDDPDPPVGNGRAASRLLAREGAIVACADRDGNAAADTVRAIEADGGRAFAITADIADPPAVREMIEEAVAGMGRLDGLVCNVGIGGPQGLADQTPEAWDRVLSVNLRGHMLTCQAAMPELPAGGAIVLVSSIAALKPGSRILAYDASKAALGGLCRGVAAEGAARGVRCNIVAPGLIDTPLGRLASRGRASRAWTPVPLGRQGTAWEVAYAVLYLISDESAYLTGQSLVLDGGLTSLR